MNPQSEMIPLVNNEPNNEEILIPESLPVLPISDHVLFPRLIVPFMVNQEKFVQMVDDAVVKDGLIGLFAGHPDKIVSHASPQDIFQIGTAAKILKMVKPPTGGMNFLVQGLSRIQIEDFIQEDPYFIARIKKLTDAPYAQEEIEALVSTLKEMFLRFVELTPDIPSHIPTVAANLHNPSELADFLAPNLPIPLDGQQSILEELQPDERIRKLMTLLNREIKKRELSKKIQDDIASEMNEEHRKYLLREQLKKIQQELGEKDDKNLEIDVLQDKIAEAGLPEEAEKVAQKELERLRMMNPSASDYNVSRTYLDWLIELPWSQETTDNLELKEAETILDEDHYDLEKVKKRILEYLAVRQLKKGMKGPILCFAGPPGVGKTSLGKSIARALGRKFHRISLGGMRDEAEIRGHRRTYVGALPGRIIQGLKKTGTKNPVFMLDEIDKLGTDFRGDPASALLEVLDPEQNSTFSDHYLEVAFDLSQVFFITTANILETIPPALRDRMEVLELPGYTEEEKLHIARKYLFPKQVEEHGMEAEQLAISDQAIRQVIRDYTREAGVRNLERQLAAVCRVTARHVVEGETAPVLVEQGDLKTYLGLPKFFSEVAERITSPGIVTGLAWTAAGGDILFVEATQMEGRNNLILTGHLGEVMKESAQAALSYLRTNAPALNLEKDFFEKTDIHLHVPAGAIPKDGPSAGITMVVAMASLFSGHKVRADMAMTGEITLRGKVLPIGGIKEKVLAAHRAGIKQILLPKLNENDLEELPEEVKEEIEFHLIDDIAEGINLALTP